MAIPPESPDPDPDLATAIAAFLADLTQARRNPGTIRTYAADLTRLAAACPGPPAAVTAADLCRLFAGRSHLQPATQARSQAAIAAFFAWAVRQDLVAANPMAKVTRVTVAPAAPRALARARIEVILAVIPVRQRRDRLLFRLLFETGLRIGEALALQVEDLDLTRDDEHLRVLGKGGRVRTILLDDPRLVHQLRAYLAATGYRHGLLFRPLKNGDGGPLRYQSVQERWAQYCARAGIACTLHQLRHSHATELVNGGVSLPTIRKRLGHRHLQTTLRYAELSDAAADRELRAWHRQGPAAPDPRR